MLHTETLDSKTLELLKRIQALPFLRQMRLVGGTGLALQLGHRISVDLDLFGQWSPAELLADELKKCGTVIRNGAQEKLQFFQINGVKVDCVMYEYPWLDPAIEEDGLRLASISDIAAMKINAITNRGSRKDFVDLFFIMKSHSLKEILTWFLAKYGDVNPAMAIRSLTYFVDAELQPMPKMLAPLDWEGVKQTIKRQVQAFCR